MERYEAPGLDRLASINTDGSRRHVHPADVDGRFIRARRRLFAVLIAIYAALPFIRVDGRPALQLDVAARRFYLFGAIFDAQDFWRVGLLLLASGALLLFLTAWVGRVWCGWACPQTVFLEGVYRRIERALEGPREARLRLARTPWTLGKAARAVAKHAAFIVVSLVLAHVALALFVSLPSALEMVTRPPAENGTAFAWVMGTTGLLYFNFAWFREQLCIVVCPYGRLQSAFSDRDTILVGYDARRGEPRGRYTRAARAGEAPPTPLGDCVDCRRCVVVCPTGIDIRQGNQLECLACTQCIDACDDVMVKLGRPTGLIRFDSQSGFDGEKRRVLRPRLFVFGGVLAACVVALVVTTSTRFPFEANLLRRSGAPYEVTAGVVRNRYELHLVNKNPVETTLRLSASAERPIEATIPIPEIRLGPLEHRRTPIFVSLSAADYTGPFPVTLRVDDSSSGRHRETIARFVGPPVAP